MIDVGKYMMRRYDCPHPCMALVADVLGEDFHIGGIPIIGKDVGMRQRAEIALDVLSRRCVEVSQACEGDIVLIRLGAVPAHVGVMINESFVLHVPSEESGVVVESLNSPWLKNRIVGFYRPKP